MGDDFPRVGLSDPPCALAHTADGQPKISTHWGRLDKSGIPPFHLEIPECLRATGALYRLW